MLSGSPASLVERARAAIERGDLLSAYDLARPEGATGSSPELAYIAVLAMARMGETEQAMRLYELSGLSTADDVDSQALGARLLKDHALQDGRGYAGLKRAAEAYADVYLRSRDPFPAINAATLNLLAGDLERAGQFALFALGAPSVAEPKDYYGAATQAEALAVLGREVEAVAAIDRALTLPGANVGARSSTLRQFELLARYRHEGHKLAPVIRRLTPPAVVTFSGHIFRADAEKEARLAELIDAHLDESNIGFGYGALAAGADILIAERLLDRGATLNLVFPFRESDFIANSVVPAGDEWLKRYYSVRERAAGINFATLADFVNDPAQFGYGATVAMGMARLRAQHLGTRAVQLALWDGNPRPGAAAGTAHDVDQWQRTGGTTIRIDSAGLDRSIGYKSSDMSPPDRRLKALLFADFPGFTRISEGKLPLFWARVMTIAGRVFADHAPDVDFTNSWGDAVFGVFSTAEAAADAGLALQAALLSVSPAELGLDRPTQMRVSLHFGPVYFGPDPITGREAFYGTEISRAARVEPLTPPGSVYASQPLAAILANTAPEKFSATYVGKIDLPKGFGQYPLYALRRRPTKAL
ncbi:tetratricopeptide repeat-containing protein [Sphingomonas sp.]|jgi:class 3 adenylate cyclase|uniref:tetratricopeptide repeat-containing protein n=1 Tax=Sphingomonas sp. TaxID=28214 RepID=UPI002DF56A3D|nr:tetratricopeptide repeat-containing protein [Sphingomonas sp.]